MTNYSSMVLLALKAALNASDEILSVYDRQFDYETKDDGTPLTAADKNSNVAITSVLKRSNIDVISEETRSPAYDKRKKSEYLWLVDPLDGTKEFIKKNGEFTVNIGLIQNSQPIIGVTAAPVLGLIYLGWKGIGAFKIKICKESQKYIFDNDIDNILQFSVKVSANDVCDRVDMAVSRSHKDNITGSIIEKLSKEDIPVKIIKIGSALKFCMIAEGSVNIYIRGSGSYEWDTASGHALVNAAGGKIFSLTDGKPLIYNKPQLHNKGFVAVASGKLWKLVKRKFAL